jgi:hypothetical protein
MRVAARYCFNIGQHVHVSAPVEQLINNENRNTEQTCYFNIFCASRIQYIVHEIASLCNRHSKLCNAMNIVSTPKIVKKNRPLQGKSKIFLHKWQVYNSYILILIRNMRGVNCQPVMNDVSL